MRRARRRWPWLLAAALLLAAGGWLMLSTEPPLPLEGPPVSLPRHITHEEATRNYGRRSWFPPVAVDDAGLMLAPPPTPRDPVMAALPSEVKKAAIVIEANAIRNSELGDLLVDCMFAGDDPMLLPTLRDAGLDPLTQIDRIAVADKTLIVSGDFSKTRWEDLTQGDYRPPTSYGRRGELFEALPGDGGAHRGGGAMALWNKQLVVFGDDPEALKQVLDRLDGSGPAHTSVLSESQAYGEVYGVLQAEALAELVGRDDERLGDVIRQSAKQVELHVDVSRDVGMVADVRGGDETKAEELRRSLGSALALARLRAKTNGEDDDAKILDFARVRSAEGSSSFRLEAGLPHDYLVSSLKRCVAEKSNRRAERLRDAGP